MANRWNFNCLHFACAICRQIKSQKSLHLKFYLIKRHVKFYAQLFHRKRFIKLPESMINHSIDYGNLRFILNAICFKLVQSIPNDKDYY